MWGSPTREGAVQRPPSVKAPLRHCPGSRLDGAKRASLSLKLSSISLAPLEVLSFRPQAAPAPPPSTHIDAVLSSPPNQLMNTAGLGPVAFRHSGKGVEEKVQGWVRGGGVKAGGKNSPKGSEDSKRPQTLVEGNGILQIFRAHSGPRVGACVSCVCWFCHFICTCCAVIGGFK